MDTSQTSGILAEGHPVALDRSQEGLLAPYLILGCVGRGFRLGSESLYVAAGVRKSQNLGIWKYGNLEILDSEILRIWKSGISQIKAMRTLRTNICLAQDVCRF